DVLDTTDDPRRLTEQDVVIDTKQVLALDITLEQNRSQDRSEDLVLKTRRGPWSGDAGSSISTLADDPSLDGTVLSLLKALEDNGSALFSRNTCYNASVARTPTKNRRTRRLQTSNSCQQHVFKRTAGNRSGLRETGDRYTNDSEQGDHLELDAAQASSQNLDLYFPRTMDFSTEPRHQHGTPPSSFSTESRRSARPLDESHLFSTLDGEENRAFLLDETPLGLSPFGLTPEGNIHHGVSTSTSGINTVQLASAGNRGEVDHINYMNMFAGGEAASRSTSSHLYQFGRSGQLLGGGGAGGARNSEELEELVRSRSSGSKKIRSARQILASSAKKTRGGGGGSYNEDNDCCSPRGRSRSCGSRSLLGTTATSRLSNGEDDGSKIETKSKTLLASKSSHAAPSYRSRRRRLMVFLFSLVASVFFLVLCYLFFSHSFFVPANTTSNKLFVSSGIASPDAANDSNKTPTTITHDTMDGGHQDHAVVSTSAIKNVNINGTTSSSTTHGTRGPRRADDHGPPPDYIKAFSPHSSQGTDAAPESPLGVTDDEVVSRRAARRMLLAQIPLGPSRNHLLGVGGGRGKHPSARGGSSPFKNNVFGSTGVLTRSSGTTG
ncbi:unnamed protein product, partial [Amoebophrya sp. A25]